MFVRCLKCFALKVQNEQRSQINPHLDHETAAHILLEDPAYW